MPSSFIDFPIIIDNIIFTASNIKNIIFFLLLLNFPENVSMAKEPRDINIPEVNTFKITSSILFLFIKKNITIVNNKIIEIVTM